MKVSPDLLRLNHDCLNAITQFLSTQDKVSLSSTCKSMHRTLRTADLMEAAVLASLQRKSEAFVQSATRLSTHRDISAWRDHLRVKTLGIDGLLRRALDPEHSPVRRALDFALFVGCAPVGVAVAVPLEIFVAFFGEPLDIQSFRDIAVSVNRSQRHEARRGLRRELAQLARALQTVPALLPAEKMREGLAPVADFIDATNQNQDLRLRAPEEATEALVKTQDRRHKRWVQTAQKMAKL